MENFHPTWTWCLLMNMVVTRFATKSLEHLTPTTTTIWWCLLISICLQHEFYPSIELSIVVKKNVCFEKPWNILFKCFSNATIFFVEFKCIKQAFLKSFKNCNSQFYIHLSSHKVSKWVSLKILKLFVV